MSPTTSGARRLAQNPGWRTCTSARIRGHHRADDAEPFLVGRRIRNSAVEMIAHRFPRLFAVSCARAFLCERMLARIMNGPRTLPKKQGSVAFGSQKSRRANASHASFMRLRRDFFDR